MQHKFITAEITIVLLLIALSGCVFKFDGIDITLPATNLPENKSNLISSKITYTMKGVGIDLPQSDFEDMKKAGIEILGTEWGMEESIPRARAFLDQAEKAGLKVVMDGGFSYTAWGFTDDDWDHIPPGKHPIWQRERVQKWVDSLKDHPAIFAWDICNEFGENLPSGADIRGSDWPRGRITLDQIKQARADVQAIDPTRPIHLRMYGWNTEKMEPYVSELLASGLIDIISLNLYSNYLERGRLEWPDVIKDAGQYYVDKIKQLSPKTKVWLSIAAFEYPETFQRPTDVSLIRDLKSATIIKNLDGISFFCWGPVNQWDDKCNWYLPQTGADLWKTIKGYLKNPDKFATN